MMITYIVAPSPPANVQRSPASSLCSLPSRQSVRSDRLPANPDAAGRMLQDVRQRRAEVELAEALLVADAHHYKIDPTLQDLVDDGRTDVTRLKQIGVHAQAKPFGNLLGLIEQILATFGLVLKLGVERKRPLHFDHMDHEHLSFRGPRRLAGKLENLGVGDISLDRNQDARRAIHAPP